MAELVTCREGMQNPGPMPTGNGVPFSSTDGNWRDTDPVSSFIAQLPDHSTGLKDLERFVDSDFQPPVGQGNDDEQQGQPRPEQGAWRTHVNEMLTGEATLKVTMVPRSIAPDVEIWTAEDEQEEDDKPGPLPSSHHWPAEDHSGPPSAVSTRPGALKPDPKQAKNGLKMIT